MDKYRQITGYSKKELEKMIELKYKGIDISLNTLFYINIE